MSDSIIYSLDIINFAKDCKEFDIDVFDIEKFGSVQIYCNDDNPAIFLKEVDSFGFEIQKSIAELHKLCWNFQKVLFLYVYSKTEIRIYNCSEKPFAYDNTTAKEADFERKLAGLELYSCKVSDTTKLQTLNTLFSRIAIDTGFIWSSREAAEIKKKINLETRVDKYLIQSLINVSRELEKQGLTDKNLVHKLVMRSLFLLYLEDKGATKKEDYKKNSLIAKSYLDLLKEGEVNYVYDLFEKLADDFNGSLFNVEKNEKQIVSHKHLELIGKCFTNGYVNTNQVELFSDWRLFDFSIIRIELLSEIYENFLSELDKKEKKNTGTFYTPPSLVELILNEKLPIKSKETNYKVKTLDPSCGSGIFLVQSFKRLIKRYENKHNSKLNDFSILVDILKSNIFGIELDSKSIKVAAFSLYLAILDNLDPKTGWWNGAIKFPYLINDPNDNSLKEQGNNLFVRDTISDLSEIEELKDFDLVVGNPPFGTKNLLPSITNYCKKENFAQEMVLPFMHKATILAPKGNIALIFNTKVLTNTGGTYQNFRKWLFNESYVEKVYNFSILRKAPKFSGGQLFDSAVGPISIVFYQKEDPEIIKDTIIYYAPKTYIKNDVLEGIVIDSSDEKHLPRFECQKPDTKIWKIAMWGSFFDFELVKKIESKYNSLYEYFITNKKDWIKGSGLHSPSKEQIQKNKFFIPIETIETGSIDKYYTSKSALKPNSKIYRPTNDLLYKSPFLIIKEGEKEKEFCSSIVDFDCYHKCYSIANADVNILKVLSSFMNSIFSSYYLSLSSSSWGIERERVQANEMLQLPAIIDKIDKNNLSKLTLIFNKIISIKKSNEVNQDITDLEKQIDQIIYNDILKLTEEEQIIIQDTLNYSLDLFEKQEKSQAVLPLINIDLYSTRIIKDLNSWLDDIDLKVSATHYTLDRNCPLYLIKLTFGDQYKEPILSKEDIYEELKNLDSKLWDTESQSIYFRKKINYYDGDDVYIIKPNQCRFWSQTAAMEDSKSLLIEILNMKE
ncbi:endonuclease [Flavobacterium columnare]|uniref:HsdM family class I SAM-dependent methyltransferase n=1 Tax=Flavobacterium columnare TaxID=996 RepID=UPI0007FB1C2D|nr:N-6 DNA methylase [Flavobacterium columnare]APT22180.1 endonuclease [Flavobacterium columnare]PDS26588.1 endonuclease [Flavobacterium columnare] [Flavobacterium columnare NBRC 100251 = ATCC 23463]GEM58462.1 type I endonuclease-methyltransferase fusion protein [Flavobacterium columnare NBRC 100251 = ATCC 23463]